MGEADGGSENPILAKLKRNKAIFWLLAFLALTGGVIRWSGDTYDGGKKIYDHFFPNPGPQRDMDADAAELGNQIAGLASIPGYLREGLTVDNVTLQKESSESRATISSRLESLKISQKFSDRDYVEPQFGEIAGATRDLSYAINSAKGDEAARYFLFQYYISRMLLETNAAPAFKRRPRWDILVTRLNETLPPGVEPFQPRAYTFQELCPYWTKHYPIGAPAPLAGKRDQAIAKCSQ